jgi:hypothetical protein
MPDGNTSKLQQHHSSSDYYNSWNKSRDDTSPIKESCTACIVGVAKARIWVSRRGVVTCVALTP